jgi:integrase
VKNKTSYRYYRAEKDYADLCSWLRGKGVKTMNPIHTLRKEFGRLLTEGYGIYAASTALRHSNVQVTAAFYAQDTRRIVPSLLGRKVAGNLPTSLLTPSGDTAAA